MQQTNFFEEGSPFLRHPLLTATRTAGEVDFLLSELGLPLGARVLDVGCGFGRHSLELGRRGYRVVGLDPSAAMVAAAQEQMREIAASVSLEVEFSQSDGQSFVADEPFEAAICLMTTLGQISEGGDNRKMLARIYANLCPGGQVVVEVPPRERTVRQLKPFDQFGAGERYTTVTRQFDPSDNSVTETFTLVAPDTTQTYLLRYHLFDNAELTHLLVAAGFTIRAAYGDYKRSPLSSESAMMVVIAQK
ncbi:MAG: class I SAM-dependent methyltransferase [Ardenticatenaceae bacterium]